MNSPLTGNPMKLCYEKAQISYRKVKCKYIRSWWECGDTKEHFVTTEMDEEHLRQINWYWQSTRNPRRKEDKTEKILRDALNKYKSWLAEEKVTKLGRTPNYIKQVTLQSKIDVIKEIQNKLKL